MHLIATSLGNAAFAVVSGKFTKFNKATMIVPASSLARSMWYGNRTQHIRTTLEKQGHSIGSIEAAWHDIAPINHINALVGKNVQMIISLTDKIIPSKYQIELVNKAIDAGINLRVIRRRVGHHGTIAWSWLSAKQLL